MNVQLKWRVYEQNALLSLYVETDTKILPNLNTSSSNI